MGKVVLITGGAKGIGRAIALKFASEGYNIAINYIGNQDEALEVQKECCAHGIEAMIYEGDVTDYDAMDQMMKAVLEQFGSIDVLVNNSGITKDQLLLKMNTQSFMDVIDVNLKGTWNCMKHATKLMMKQKYGRIVSMSSVVGVMGNAGQVNYAASKSGIIGMTMSLAREVGSRGITVNAVAPGFIQTAMTDVLSDDTKENILKNIPLQQMGEPEDVANVAYFLASDSAKYITGQVINVDGGMVM